MSNSRLPVKGPELHTLNMVSTKQTITRSVDDHETRGTDELMKPMTAGFGCQLDTEVYLCTSYCIKVGSHRMCCNARGAAFTVNEPFVK